MLVRFLVNVLFGKPKGAFVIERKDQNKVTHFLVRPGVIVVEDKDIRFQNLTPHRVKIEPGRDFLKSEEPFFLEGYGDKDKRDRTKVDLKDGATGFHEYEVWVYADPDNPQAARGDSRPGAIIDR